jgi:hypothetical protein
MKKIFRVYVAGPYAAATRWEEEQHVRRAEAVGYEVARRGAYPVIPHTNTRPLFSDLHDADWWYAATLAELRTCDAVVLVPGWRQSTGATREKEAAEQAGIPVFLHVRDLEGWFATRTKEEEGDDGEARS